MAPTPSPGGQVPGLGGLWFPLLWFRKGLGSISMALNVFSSPISHRTQTNRLSYPGSPAGPRCVGRAQQRERCLRWSPGPHVLHSSLHCPRHFLFLLHVTLCSVNTATADKTINSVHVRHLAFQQSTENRSVSSVLGIGPSQESFPPDKKGKERR